MALIQKRPLKRKSMNPTGRGGMLGLLSQRMAMGIGNRKKRMAAQNMQARQGLSSQVMAQRQGTEGMARIPGYDPNRQAVPGSWSPSQGMPQAQTAQRGLRGQIRPETMMARQQAMKQGSTQRQTNLPVLSREGMQPVTERQRQAARGMMMSQFGRTAGSMVG